MLDEQQPVEEVEVEEVTQPEIIEETETEETETEETPAPSAELDEEKQREIARNNYKNAKERVSRRQREEELRRENEYLRKMALGNQQAQPTKPQSVRSGPRLEDFADEDDWIDAKLAHRDAQIRQKVQAEEYKKGYNQKLSEYAESNPDVFEYESYVAEIVSPTVADFIVNSEMTGQLIEAIALDPKKAKALNNSKTQYELGKNIIKLEESLSKKPKFSNAPPPVNQPKSDPVISGKDPSSMSKKDYAEWRNSQRK
jgi:hypothetical protein